MKDSVKHIIMLSLYRLGIILSFGILLFTAELNHQNSSWVLVFGLIIFPVVFFGSMWIKFKIEEL